MIVWPYRPTVLFRLEAEAGMSPVCGGPGLDAYTNILIGQRTI